jgi:hypothetical protein
MAYRFCTHAHSASLYVANQTGSLTDNTSKNKSKPTDIKENVQIKFSTRNQLD